MSYDKLHTSKLPRQYRFDDLEWSYCSMQVWRLSGHVPRLIRKCEDCWRYQSWVASLENVSNTLGIKKGHLTFTLTSLPIFWSACSSESWSHGSGATLIGTDEATLNDCSTTWTFSKLDFCNDIWLVDDRTTGCTVAIFNFWSRTGGVRTEFPSLCDRRFVSSGHASDWRGISNRFDASRNVIRTPSWRDFWNGWHREMYRAPMSSLRILSPTRESYRTQVEQLIIPEQKYRDKATSTWGVVVIAKLEVWLVLLVEVNLDWCGTATLA